jgi:TRAP-type C4-dicarboxylate transport system substrate-binding protein
MDEEEHNMKTKLLFCMLILLMAFPFSACGGNPPADAENEPADTGDGEATAETDRSDWIDLDLTFATFLAENNPCQGIITSLQENLEEVMPGKVTITTYGNATLLAAADIYDGVINGTADIGYVQVDFMADRLPIAQLPQLSAFAYNSAGVATQVWRDFLAEVQPAEFDDVVIIQCQCGGPQAFQMGNAPIGSFGDFKGKQIATGGSRGKTVAAYGATPVTMDTTEYYEGLRSGLVDGVYTMFGAGAFANLDDVVDYALISPLQNSVYVFAMNKDVFNSMPPSQREAFMAACAANYDDYTINYQEDGLSLDRVRDYAKALKEIDFIEGDLLEECKKANEPILEEYLTVLESKGFDNPQRYVDLLNGLIDKYNAEYPLDNYKALFDELRAQ